MINMRSAWNGRNCWERFVRACVLFIFFTCAYELEMTGSLCLPSVLSLYFCSFSTPTYVVPRPPALAHNWHLVWRKSNVLTAPRTKLSPFTRTNNRKLQYVSNLDTSIKYLRINRSIRNTAHSTLKNTSTLARIVVRIRKRAAWHVVRVCATYCGRDTNKSARALSIIGTTEYVCVSRFARRCVLFLTTCYACTHDNVECVYIRLQNVYFGASVMRPQRYCRFCELITGQSGLRERMMPERSNEGEF